MSYTAKVSVQMLPIQFSCAQTPYTGHEMSIFYHFVILGILACRFVSTTLYTSGACLGTEAAFTHLNLRQPCGRLAVTTGNTVQQSCRRQPACCGSGQARPKLAAEVCITLGSPYKCMPESSQPYGFKAKSHMRFIWCRSPRNGVQCSLPHCFIQHYTVV